MGWTPMSAMSTEGEASSLSCTLVSSSPGGWPSRIRQPGAGQGLLPDLADLITARSQGHGA
eukprot:11036616-Lingulodinium_polyedra.AAC.1